jgi:putative resolvase
MSDYYRVAGVAKQLKISPSTVRKYANEGKIEYSHNPAGQRVFTQAQIDTYLGTNSQQRLAFYSRCSRGDKINIAHQQAKLEEAYGPALFQFKDGASGLNENRPGLWRLLESAKQGEYNTLAITAKDRLSRFGYRYLEELLKDRGVTLIVLDDEREKSLNEELMADFMSLLASFSGKFYKLRGIEQRKLLLEKAKTDLNARN